MKKIAAVIMVILLVLTAILTGCTKKEKSTDTDNGAYDRNQSTDASKEYTGSTDTVEQEASSGNSTSSENYNYAPTNTAKAPAYSADASLKENSSAQFDSAYTVRSPYTVPYPNTEEYSRITETGFLDTYLDPLSTFSIDVDTASYTNFRKNVNYGIIPEADSIRIEEMLNYFSYDYEQPKDGRPFSINTEIGKCPWNEENYLITVGIQGKNADISSLPKSNLVFLIDVSGSMDEPDKLLLLKDAFSQLVKVLGEDDKISVVAYAGSSGIVLDSVRGDKKEIILDAIEDLTAGGSTGGAEGIDTAYRLAEENFIKGGNNRVILATDGDFNVGPSSTQELEEIITKKRESGVFLSVMGFGTGNLKDNKMEILADKGNGNYSYIDTPREARKVLVDEMAGTLLTIAKDVKIQLEFNPASVESYRLIGYENRALQDEDFKDDSVDAGELGAGHRVTAVYEVVPIHAVSAQSDLKYQYRDSTIKDEYRNEITEIRLRYKEPNENDSKEIKKVVSFENTPVKGRNLSEDFYFSAAIAEFGMLASYSAYSGNADYNSVLELAKQGIGEDKDGYRREFISLVQQYQNLVGYSTYGW